MLEAVIGILVLWRLSMGQIIQHSDDIRRMYKQACEACKDAGESCISTVFTHLRAAKHRIESFTTPLSRAVTNFSAYIATAQRIAIVRRGKVEGSAAEVFLLTITVVFCLLAAMMADGSSVVLQVIRLFDTEEISVPQMCEALEESLDTKNNYTLAKGP